MPVEKITTSTTTSIAFPRATVSVSDALGRDWDEVDYLYCDLLKVAAAPDIDQADLSYVYGPICREPRGDQDEPDYESEGTALQLYPPLDLMGKFCKIVVEGAANDGSDLTWYGLIEMDEREPMGSGSNSLVPNADPEQMITEDQFAANELEANQGEPRGKQKLTAFGLIRLLELTTVLSATINQTTTDELPDATIEIGTGIPFNSYRPGEYKDRGNRSTLPSNIEVLASPEQAGDGGGTPTGLQAVSKPNWPYVFSELPQRTRHWNAAHAATYLLNFNAPEDASGNPICQWMLTGGPDDVDGTATLGWYDISVHTDGKNVKQILDELISRRRGVGYYITYSEDGGASESGTGSTGQDSVNSPNGVATVNVFSFNNTILNYGPGFESATKPNANQRSLDFENAFDVECHLVNSISSKYDTVIALGAHKTSTFTLSLDPSNSQIAADWTAAEESLYKAGASDNALYATWSLDQQQRQNMVARQRDQIRHVYRRFELDESWAHYVWDYDALDVTYYLVAPLYNADGTAYEAGEYNIDRKDQGDTIWNKGLVFLPKLSLKDRFDYSGSVIADGTFEQTTVTGENAADIEGEPENLHPMFFTKTAADPGQANCWEFLERLSSSSPWNGDGTGRGRQWSANVNILQQRPAFEINVAGGEQHFIAKTAFIGAAAFNPLHDPNSPIQNGIDFSSIRCTITAQLFDRALATAAVDADAELVPGRIERILYIQVHDARLDYVVPTTIVGIKEGQLQQTTGGFVRDDRPRLQSIATSAAEWYGRPRQTIELKLKQVSEVVKLGWLITDVGPNYQLANVNTPITSCVYDLLHGTTTFRTSHVDIEFE